MKFSLQFKHSSESHFTDWNEMYKKQFTPWHQNEVSKSLKLHLETITDIVRPNKTTHEDQKRSKEDGLVFLVPLCGKSVDLIFLYQQGFQVISSECSELACEQFFTENDIEYVRQTVEGGFDCFQVFVHTSLYFDYHICIYITIFKL